MSKDMLGPIVRALVGVPQQHHGLILDVVNKLGGKDAIEVRKRIAQALREAPASKVKTPLDTIIRVDRAVRPVYPDWVKKVMHPELEGAGPSEYDLATVELWLHDSQKGGNWLNGQGIYGHLKSNNMLDGCLGLADGLEIQKKGVAVFRKFFGGKAVFLWKSVVPYRDSDLNVPYLIEVGGEVVVRWGWLDDGWLDGHPAARFASPPTQVG